MANGIIADDLPALARAGGADSLRYLDQSSGGLAVEAASGIDQKDAAPFGRGRFFVALHRLWKPACKAEKALKEYMV